MKFTLIYEGELASNGRPVKKWEIRNQLHPQLQELWRVSPILKNVERHRFIPNNQTFWRMEVHHSIPDIEPREQTSETMDLCEPIQVGDRKFIPLVRSTFALVCSLKIMFLRKEVPGRVYQGGDLLPLNAPIFG